MGKRAIMSAYHYLIIDGIPLHVTHVVRDVYGIACEAYVINGDWLFRRNASGRCFALRDNGYCKEIKNEFTPSEILEVKTEKDMDDMSSEEYGSVISAARARHAEALLIEATNYVI